MPTGSSILILISVTLTTVAFAQNYVAPMTGSDRVHRLFHQNPGAAILAECVLVGAEFTLSNSPNPRYIRIEGSAMSGRFRHIKNFPQTTSF